MARLVSRLFLPRFFWVLAFALVISTPRLRAVIFYSTAETNFNTTAPAGTLLDSGWQWVGTWGGFQGTPIGPHHFLAAKHVGGNVGEFFVFQGINYTTIGSTIDATSDLRIWEVSETFPTWAPLYRSSNEVGRSLMVFGRGVTRGAEVRTAVAVSGVPSGSLAGWQYTASDGQLRWGQNTIATTYTHPDFGPQLVAYFDKTASGTNECHLGLGDSSGPVFINDGNGWKLAGVAGLVESGFSTTSGGATFSAAIFDKRGLFLNGLTSPQTGNYPAPSAFFATRISARLAWIDSVLPVLVESADAPLLPPTGIVLFAGSLLGVGVFYLRPEKRSTDTCNRMHSSVVHDTRGTGAHSPRGNGRYE